MKLIDFFVCLREKGDFYSFDVLTRNGTKVPDEFMGDAWNMEVIKFDRTGEKCEVYINASIDGLAPDNTKFYWRVTQAAAGNTTGYVLLTKNEAYIVAYATDCNNWKNVDDEVWCGCFSIDLDNPIPVDEFEKGVR